MDASTPAIQTSAAIDMSQRFGGRRGRRRTVPAAALTAALMATLAAGCGGALNDYSATERALPNSVNVDAGPIALRHLRVQVIDGQVAAEDAAVLRGTVLNLGGGHDALLRVTTPVAGAVSLVSFQGQTLADDLPLRPSAVQRMQHPSDPGWMLADLREPLRPGTSVSVTFHFAAQGEVTAAVPVTADERTNVA